jgi:hypothetical protein
LIKTFFAQQGTDAFWYLQAKDFVTLFLSAVAFVVAFANFRLHYLRPPRVRLLFGTRFEFAIDGPKGSKKLRIAADVVLFNLGAQAALVDYIRIHLHKKQGIQSRHLNTFLWVNFSNVENVSPKGTPERFFNQVEPVTPLRGQEAARNPAEKAVGDHADEDCTG